MGKDGSIEGKVETSSHTHHGATIADTNDPKNNLKTAKQSITSKEE